MTKNTSCKNKDIFTDIYINNKWGCSESRSGPGSRVFNNKKFLDLLENFCKTHDIQTIIDCGCGDFNWMRLFNFKIIKEYLGIDIVDEVVKVNNSNYSNNIVKFKSQSIISESIKPADLILCKDVLFHLSYKDASMALDNIKSSNPKYFISTNFSDFENFDIKTGGWRPINLLKEPFSLGNPYLYWENIEDRSDKYSNKSIGIWKF